LSYGVDISEPAKDVKEAIQWLYFGYLAAIKEQNGAAMSIGRISTFLDIYAETDLQEGRYTESEIQEFVDHFVMKLRMVRFLRTHSYDELFSGDPTWVTESLGGVGIGRTAYGHQDDTLHASCRYADQLRRRARPNIDGSLEPAASAEL
jgi:formate C-acetyltransferase